MQIEKMIEQCLKDSQAWFPENLDIPFLTLALCGEAGEVANEVKKIVRGSASFPEANPKLREECIDVLIYLCNLMGLLEMDIEQEYNDKRARNVERFSPAGTRQLSLEEDR